MSSRDLVVFLRNKKARSASSKPNPATPLTVPPAITAVEDLCAGTEAMTVTVAEGAELDPIFAPTVTDVNEVIVDGEAEVDEAAKDEWVVEVEDDEGLDEQDIDGRKQACGNRWI